MKYADTKYDKNILYIVRDGYFENLLVKRSKIYFDEVVKLIGRNRRTFIFDKDNTGFIIAKSIGKVFEHLPPADFIRIHRSIGMNRKYYNHLLERKNGQSNRSAEMLNKSIINVARRRCKWFMEEIRNSPPESPKT